MKPILLLFLLAARSMANGYGSVSITYGHNTPPVISYGPSRSISEQSHSLYTPAVPVHSYAPHPAPVHSYVPAAPVIPYAPAAPAAYAPAAPAAYAPAPYAPTYGASSEQVPQIPITRYDHQMREGQSHRISFETGHGISHEEHTHIRMNPNALGTPEDRDAGKATLTKTGSISYTSPEGKRINLQYTADENGFHPTGDHLPVPPPLPIELVEARNRFQAAYDLAAKASARAPQAPESGNYGYAYAPPSPHVPEVSYGSPYGHAPPAPAKHYSY